MDDCIFCNIVDNKIENWTVYENDMVKAFFDVNPASKGHTLVIPKWHYENLYDVPEDFLSDMIKVAKKIAICYKKAFWFDNVNILSSSWTLAGQDTFHFHIHVIPRYVWDQVSISYTPDYDVNKNFDILLDEIKKSF